MRMSQFAFLLMLVVTQYGRAAELDALQKQAVEGNATAQYQLAEIFFSGEGVLQNFAATLQWAGKAAEQKEPRALYRLAAMLHQGDGVQRNMAQAGAMFQESLKGLRELAQKGDPDAMGKLGTLFTTGVTAPPDLKEGLKWIRKSAEAGWPKAQYDLAGHLLFGRGVSPDKNEALEWMDRAAKGGHANAQYSLGAANANADGMARNLETARQWLLKARRSGDPKLSGRAKQLLAKVESGDLRELPDLKTLGASAAKGVADAQYRLGRVYREGIGVVQDYLKAEIFFRKSAQQGHSLSCYGLGGLYMGGLGVEKDAKEAHKWWSQAASQGLTVAQLDMGILLVKGEGVPRDNAKAYMWLTLAARAEDSAVQSRASKMRSELSRVMKGGEILEGLRRARKFKPVESGKKPENK